AAFPARRCARGAPRGVARLGQRAARRAAPARRARAAGNGVTPPHLALGAGGEFDRLRAIFRALGRGARDLGDDCALLRLGRTTLALSIDASLEGVHFRTEWLSFREIGWRAGAAALSDLAAEGATPLGVLVSLGVPASGKREGGNADPAAEIMRGVAAVAKSVGARVLGGDLTRSSRYLVDVCAIGTADRPVRRSGARSGDGLWVTGRLGGAGLGLARLRGGRRGAGAVGRGERMTDHGRRITAPPGFDHFPAR